MRTLFHLPLDPDCRLIRIMLGEKRLEASLKTEQVWERRENFLKLNPAGEVPVLLEADGTSIAGAPVIAEYLDEAYADPPLIGADLLDRAEVRRLMQWFTVKFAREVSRHLIEEKVTKRFLKMGQPSASAIRAGLANIHYHLDYVAWLNDRRRWLAGESFSLGDIAAAAHFSAIDYLGDVPWDKHPGAKDWYARVKSRPSMRGILADHVAGANPPKHYADLDF